MNQNIFTYVLLLCGIFILSFFTKFWQLKEPDLYYFDEIYYGFTAEQYALGNIDAWFYEAAPPKGFSYTWDHPPTGKLIMSLPIKIFGASSLSRRLAPATFGFLLTVLIYFIYIKFINTPTNKIGGLLASFLITIEGITLSMSRIALVDIILTVFILLSALLIWKRKTFLAGIFFGLAISTKWSGFFLLGVFIFREFLFYDFSKLKEGGKFLKNLILARWYILDSFVRFFGFFIVGLGVYVFSYTPFLINYGWGNFINLQKVMFLYHTNLNATHPFESKAYMWPLGLKPVWLYTESGAEWVRNIYIVGNFVVLWAGIVSVLILFMKAVQNHSKLIMYLIYCYSIIWVPWILSIRIMFLYHYLPSIPFLIILQAYVLERIMVRFKKLGLVAVLWFIFICLAVFVYTFPSLTGIKVSKNWDNNYLWRKILK